MDKQWFGDTETVRSAKLITSWCLNCHRIMYSLQFIYRLLIGWQTLATACASRVRKEDAKTILLLQKLAEWLMTRRNRQVVVMYCKLKSSLNFEVHTERQKNRVRIKWIHLLHTRLRAIMGRDNSQWIGRCDSEAIQSQLFDDKLLPSLSLLISFGNILL